MRQAAASLARPPLAALDSQHNTRRAPVASSPSSKPKKTQSYRYSLLFLSSTLSRSLPPSSHIHAAHRQRLPTPTEPRGKGDPAGAGALARCLQCALLCARTVAHERGTRQLGAAADPRRPHACAATKVCSPRCPKAYNDEQQHTANTRPPPSHLPSHVPTLVATLCAVLATLDPAQRSAAGTSELLCNLIVQCPASHPSFAAELGRHLRVEGASRCVWHALALSRALFYAPQSHSAPLLPPRLGLPHADLVSYALGQASNVGLEGLAAAYIQEIVNARSFASLKGTCVLRQPLPAQTRGLHTSVVLFCSFALFTTKYTPLPLRSQSFCPNC